MRRLVLASLAFLLLFLPFQAGSVSATPAMPCCPCSGEPACPPRCPAPSPSITCVAVPPAMALPGEVEAAVQRNEEPSPAPTLVIEQSRFAGQMQGSFNARAFASPPDRSDGQALLRVFRI